MNDPKNFREALGIPHWVIVAFTVVHLALDFETLVNLFRVGWGDKGVIYKEQNVRTQLLIEPFGVMLQVRIKV
jgi:hypothetical protein